MWPTPKTIDTAPTHQENDKPFLLWCPEQGGWHTGFLLNTRWVDSLTLSDPLVPTHWLETPPNLQIAAREFDALATVTANA